MDQVSSQEAQDYPLCGAKTRTGGTCKNYAMPNGRCRMHGGNNKGNPRAHGNTSAVTHGIYRSAMSDAELEQLPEIQSRRGKLEDEIDWCRTRIIRASVAEAEQTQALERRSHKDSLEIEEVLEREGNGVPIADREVKFRKVDYQTIIDRLTNLLIKLERAHKDLLSEDQGDKPIDGIEIVEYDD